MSHLRNPNPSSLFAQPSLDRWICPNLTVPDQPTRDSSAPHALPRATPQLLRALEIEPAATCRAQIESPAYPGRPSVTESGSSRPPPADPTTTATNPYSHQAPSTLVLPLYDPHNKTKKRSQNTSISGGQSGGARRPEGPVQAVGEPAWESL
ncbi:hypothetical protein V6N11_029158 [Hibiscus sabdariffa]|uniref:Uncharacterized protein n=2 Tax=Hibiscus sabdariffa TaxID=183260 RepID=A0ABR2NRI6_9ROSI